ncbi:MAG: hypothetical protein LBL48_01205 [Azoarcus sp.]|jgi:hypothetical protein|nr:hypothetical protein [Azoarcus sp.]
MDVDTTTLGKIWQTRIIPSPTFARALEHPKEIEGERPVYFNVEMTY